MVDACRKINNEEQTGMILNITVAVSVEIVVSCDCVYTSLAVAEPTGSS